MDNYGTHNHPKVREWLAKHDRFKMHFTPTSSSWLNVVGHWFRELTDKRIRRGSFGGVDELVAAIEEYLRIYNTDPKPFIWTATVTQILEPIARRNAIYETLR